MGDCSWGYGHGHGRLLRGYGYIRAFAHRPRCIRESGPVLTGEWAPAPMVAPPSRSMLVCEAFMAERAGYHVTPTLAPDLSCARRRASAAGLDKPRPHAVPSPGPGSAGLSPTVRRLPGILDSAPRPPQETSRAAPTATAHRPAPATRRLRVGSGSRCCGGSSSPTARFSSSPFSCSRCHPSRSARRSPSTSSRCW